MVEPPTGVNTNFRQSAAAASAGADSTTDTASNSGSGAGSIDTATAATASRLMADEIAAKSRSLSLGDAHAKREHGDVVVNLPSSGQRDS